jgi:hypothetical protein
MKLHGKLDNNASKVTAVFFHTKPKLTQEEWVGVIIVI